LNFFCVKYIFSFSSHLRAASRLGPAGALY